MRYIIREAFYFFAAICSIYGLVHMLMAEDWQCQLWGALGAIVTTYIAYKVTKLLLRRKNAEIITGQCRVPSDIGLGGSSS